MHDLAGNLLIDFTQEGERDVCNTDTDHWVGCTVQLDPGAYLLRIQMARSDETGAADILEQTIVTCASWQTQVLLLRRFYGSSNDCQTLRADLSAASILIHERIACVALAKHMEKVAHPLKKHSLRVLLDGPAKPVEDSSV